MRVGHGADTLLQQAGLVGDLMPVELRVRMSNSGTAKATEVLEALLGRADVPARFVRAAMLCTKGGHRVSPVELASIRSAFAAERTRQAAADAAVALS